MNCFIDGKRVEKKFVVEKAPLYFGTAPRFEDKKMGLTVRDLTYEVRRYFHKTKNDPGVIISKIEQGGKASVAGLKPYEIIISVNDKAVNNIKDFENLLKQGGDLKLGVLRMSTSRTVKIKSDDSDE